MENFGDRPSYPPNQGRPKQFGTCYLRLDLPIETDWVVTVEPGFYIVDAILEDVELQKQFQSMVHFEKLNKWSAKVTLEYGLKNTIKYFNKKYNEASRELAEEMQKEVTFLDIESHFLQLLKEGRKKMSIVFSEESFYKASLNNKSILLVDSKGKKRALFLYRLENAIK